MWLFNKKNKIKIPDNAQEFFAKTNSMAMDDSRNADSRLEADVKRAKNSIPTYLHQYVRKTHIPNFVRIRIDDHYDIYWSDESSPFLVVAGRDNVRRFTNIVDAVAFAKMKDKNNG